MNKVFRKTAAVLMAVAMVFGALPSSYATVQTETDTTYSVQKKAANNIATVSNSNSNSTQYQITLCAGNNPYATDAQVYVQIFSPDEDFRLANTGFAYWGTRVIGWSYSPQDYSKEPRDQLAFTQEQTIPAGTFNNNVILYAIWEGWTYTIKFDANGGTGTMADQTKRYEKGTINKCTYTNGDKDFLGWADKPDGAPILSDGSWRDHFWPSYDGDSCTLYAIWGDKCLETGTYFQQDIATLMQWNGTDVSAIKNVQWITDLNSVNGLSSKARINISDRHVHTDKGDDLDCWYVEYLWTGHVCDENCGPGYSDKKDYNNVIDPDTGEYYHHSTYAEQRTQRVRRCIYDEGEHMWQFYAYYMDGTLYLYNAENPTKKMCLNSDASGMFQNWTNLTSMDFSVFNLRQMTNNVNILTNDKNLEAVTFPSDWHFYGSRSSDPHTTVSGLGTVSEHWHKEDDDTQSAKIWHVGENGSGNFEGTNGHKAGDGCQTVDLGGSSDGVGENYTCDTDQATGFETMFNSAPSQYAGTWLPGLGTSHRYWKTDGVANLNNMIETHHPEAPFTTFCWAQHRGPNSGWYDRVEVKSEAQMIANLQVYNQSYRSLPTSQLLLDGESSVSDPMRRSFITIMYYGDVENDPLGLKAKYGLTDQELAYVTMGAVQWCSDSAESYCYTDAMVQAKREILAQSYKNIPNAKNIKFYIYLSAHEGGGQQQMGIESIQTEYYGGFISGVVNSTGEPLSGCEITIYRDPECTQPVKSFTTNENGEAGSCRMDSQYGLAVGTYYAKQTSTVRGYEKSDDVIKFDVKKDRVTETGYKNNSDSKVILQFVNKGNIVSELGTLTIRKVSSNKTNKGLVGATYGVYARSNITASRTTGESVVLYSADEKVATITTGQGGYGSTRLQKGEYYVKEETAPGGYKIATESSDTISITKGQTTSKLLADKPKSGTFTITAKKEIAKGYKIKDGMFTFNLYKQESELENGKPKLTFVESATNDADGNVTFSTLTYNADDETDYAGEVQYAIKEVAPTSDQYPRYLYDDHIEYVAGAVVDDGSDTLKIKLTYSSDQSGESATFRTTGKFTNTYNKAPEIPNPTKTVSKGKSTIVQDLHNVVDHQGNYQYDVYQVIPAEKSIDYFESFEFYDKFPAGVRVTSWKVYAGDTDVTDKWQIVKTTENDDNDATRQDTITAKYVGDLSDASAYGVTYDFRFQVTQTEDVEYKKTVSNYAATMIRYKDIENHYILDADGNVQKDADGNPLYETTNDYVKNGNSVADPNFTTKTTTDSSKAVHYRTTNEVLTDVIPLGSITVKKTLPSGIYYTPQMTDEDKENYTKNFIFELTNTETGEQYWRAVKVKMNEMDQAVATFEKLPLGTYTFTESKELGYSLSSVTGTTSKMSFNKTNGVTTIQLAEGKQNKDIEVTVENNTEEYIPGVQPGSGVVNYVGTPMPISLKVEYTHGDITDKNATSYTFVKSDFANMTVTYADGTYRDFTGTYKTDATGKTTKISDEPLRFEEVTLSPATVTNNDNTGDSGKLTVNAYYTEKGKTLGDDFQVGVHLKPNQKFIFHANGGAFADTLDTNTVQTVRNEDTGKNSVISGAYLDPDARTGWTFTGWNTKADGNGKAYDASTVLDESADSLELYAQWKRNTYTVQFNGNGNTDGSMADQNIAYDSTKALSDNEYTKTGYKFVGWATSPDGDVVYADKESVKNLSAKDGAVVGLYAKWEPISYSVKFVANTDDASGSMDTQEFTYDQSNVLSNNKFTRDGYQLTGWATSKNGAKVYDNMQPVMNLADAEDTNITLYGIWTPVVDVTGLSIDDTSHTHVWKWKYDETKHWQECDVCGAKQESAVHTMTTTGSTTCGSYTTDVCSVCGYEGTKTFHPHIMHIFTDSDSAEVLTKKFTNHNTYYHVIGYCIRCGETTLNYGQTALETTGELITKPIALAVGTTGDACSTQTCIDSDGNPITCVNRKVCAICGYDYGADAHISHHSVKKRIENNIEIYSCQFCGKDMYKIYHSWAKQDADNPRHWEIGGIFELLDGEWNTTGSGHGHLVPWGPLVESGAASVTELEVTPLSSDMYNNASMNTTGKTSGLWQVSYTADISEQFQGSQYVRLNADNILKNINGNSNEYAKTYALAATIIPDNDAPVIQSVKGNGSGTADKYSTSAYVNVTATDKVSDYVTIRLYDKSGNEIAQPATVASSNGTFIYQFDLSKSEVEIKDQPIVVSVTDRYGHQTKQEYGNVATYIDTKAPVLTNPLIKSDWAKSVTYTAEATDGGSGNVKIGLNKLDDLTLGTKSDSGYARTYAFAGDKYDDINYVIFLQDGAQNISQTKINIGYIDNTAPHINKVSINGKSVTIEADDTNAALGKVGSGVDKYGYMSTSETTIRWSSSATIALPSAGRYYVFARDAVGNISEPQSITIQ